ncbi:MAG: hyfA [Burkholderiaceae bacterium]|nr:hyfA [Burkholderiaceae bacterium]
MNRFIFANPKLCAGCDACVDACADAHKAAGLQAQARITIVRSGDVSSPITCRHCENAPCATICPVNAISLGENAVELSEADCIGCKLCAVACPFGVISFSSSGAKGAAAKDDGEREASAPPVAATVAVKCDLCSFAENGPECVRACATKALFVVDAKALRKASTARRKAAVQNLPSFIDSQGE